VGKEYGVTAGTEEAIPVTDTAPGSITDTQIQQFINDKITAGTFPSPAPTTNGTPIYMVYFPSTTTVTDNKSGGTSCSNGGFAGYHGAGSNNGTKFAYAVIPDCGSGLNDVTSTAAHELIEAATDPWNTPDDGYYLDVAADDLWNGAAGDEVADMCDFEPLTTEGSWQLERSYSNAAAAAGTSPCVPVPAGDVYYNVSATPKTVQTVAAGKSFTFTITGWSTAAIAPWAIQTAPADSADFDPKATLSVQTINNGLTATVTLTAPANAKTGTLGAAFVVSGDAQHLWPVAIQVQ
jgi:hypothetical protein